MPEINLLENRLKDTTHARERQIKLGLAILGFILAVLVITGGVLFFLNRNLGNQISDKASENQSLQKQLNQKQSELEQAKIFQAQLENLKTLIKNHIYLSPLFTELGKVTYVKSQYAVVDLNKTGTIHLEGKVPTYKDLAKLMLGLQTSKQFSNVKLLSVGPSNDSIQNGFKFVIEMNVATSIFYKN